MNGIFINRIICDDNNNNNNNNNNKYKNRVNT